MPAAPMLISGRYCVRLIASSVSSGEFGCGPFGFGPVPRPFPLTHRSFAQRFAPFGRRFELGPRSPQGLPRSAPTTSTSVGYAAVGMRASSGKSPAARRSTAPPSRSSSSSSPPPARAEARVISSVSTRSPARCARERAEPAPGRPKTAMESVPAWATRSRLPSGCTVRSTGLAPSPSGLPAESVASTTMAFVSITATWSEFATAT